MSAIPESRRSAAVEDYRRGGGSLRKVAARHGVTHQTLAVWIKPPKFVKPREPWTWAEVDIELIEGRWMPNSRGIQVWEPNKTA